MAAERDSVRTLIARCTERTEPLPLRLRLAHLLQTTDLTPGGLPPRAILLVRRVVAPRALTLAGARVSARWEQSVRDVIAERYRTAARPERGAIPRSAEAVLFVDQSELLACLGVTVVEPSDGPCWYWQGAAGRATVPSAEALTRAWRDAPLHLPAAMRYLLGWQQAAATLRQLSEPQISSLLQAIVAAFRLPADVATLAKPSSTGSADAAEAGAGREEESPARTAAGRPGDAAHRKHSLPHTQTPEARDAVSGKETPVLPQWASGTELMLLYAEWRRLPRLSRRLLTLAVSLAHASSPAQAAATVRALEEQLRGQAEPILGSREADRTAAIRPDSDVQAGGASVAVAEVAIPGPVSGVFTATTPGDEPMAREPRPGESGTLQPTQTPGADVEPAAPAETKSVRYGLEGNGTQIGGVLYLLNLLRADVPGSLDADAAFPLSRHLSLWGLTELLGRALLATHDADLADDPLWTVLAHLDGRQPGKPPGMNVSQGTGYRMPPIWLRRFTRYIARDTDRWHTGATADRLVVWHGDREFALLDCPCGAVSVSEACERERAWYRDRGVELTLPVSSAEYSLPLPILWEGATGSWDDANWPVLHWLRRCQERAGWEELPLGLVRWMRGAFPFLRWLLRRMLGDGSIADADIAGMLCVPGRLYAGATHVDLVMALNSISLPVRRVGLDIDPGWLPDVMRVVSFHFE